MFNTNVVTLFHLREVVMLTFNVMVKSSSVRKGKRIVVWSAVHSVKANSKDVAANKASRWIESVLGSQSVEFRLQADRRSAATCSIATKRARKVDSTVKQITV